MLIQCVQRVTRRNQREHMHAAYARARGLRLLHCMHGSRVRMDSARHGLCQDSARDVSTTDRSGPIGRPNISVSHIKMDGPNQTTRKIYQCHNLNVDSYLRRVHNFYETLLFYETAQVNKHSTISDTSEISNRSAYILRNAKLNYTREIGTAIQPTVSR
jgi:hypothetical protein